MEFTLHNNVKKPAGSLKKSIDATYNSEDHKAIYKEKIYIFMHKFDYICTKEKK
jgi:hypothetical protein